MNTLPNKWKVKITESNREVLEQWRIKQPNVKTDSELTCFYKSSLNKWLISDQNYDNTYMDWGDAEYYTEITFEQFKQFVLMENKPQFKVGDKVIIKKNSDGYGTYGWRGKFQCIILTQGYLTVEKVTNIDNDTQTINFKECKWGANSLWLTLYTENKPQFRPITMDCNQQQFDAIKPILEKHGFKFDIGGWDFTCWPYLTNNYGGCIRDLTKIIGNAPDRDSPYRPYGGQWNQELFLQCCGIVQQHTFQVEDKVRLKQGITKEQMDDMCKKTNVGFPSPMVADFNKALDDPKHEFVVREVSSSNNTMKLRYNNDSWYWPIEAFEPINHTEMKTYKVTIDQLKQIHDVACGTWKTKIKSLITDPFADHVELSQQQVDEMFKAALNGQRPVLVSVFGEPEKHCPYKKGQLLWVWDNHNEYPSVRPFQ